MELMCEPIGDVMVVNGRSWPFLNVEPRRYRFRILDGSNARFVRMGHTPRTVELSVEERNPNFPFTLDLRR